ncbi:hypothetical protein [Flavobacterium sp.]|uniref:hypothetical protein n=1 Tax=Flavobacterium sp. TaxID=239 RepID=UPI00260AF995|nr:hypothetical protein [Flavobacterium sp.]
MKIIKKHRKIFYVPGMISLVVLPILFLWFLNFNNSFKEYTCIRLGLADKQSFNEILEKFDFPNLRNYKIFVFNNTLEKEKNNLRSFQKSLRIQNKFRDTINGIKLQFGKKMTYEVYIKILDILNIENTPTYIDYQNNLWILNGNRKNKKIDEKENKHLTVNCGTSYYTYIETLKIEAKEKEKERKEFFISYNKKVWYLYVAYLGLVVLNIFALLKFNRNRKYSQKSYL